MRMILAFVAVSSVTLTLVAFSIIVLTPPLPIASYQPLSGRLMPGNPRPRGTRCDWYYHGEINGSCHVEQSPDVIVSFSYSRQTGLITRASIQPPGDQTIGKLILAWGRPLGYVGDAWGATIYWDKRAAYTFSRAFGPHSRVWYIEYFAEVPFFRPWHGFKSMKVFQWQR